MIIVNHLPPAFLGDMEYFITFLLVGSDDFQLQIIKYSTELWRQFKHEYHSDVCVLLTKLLGHPLSNASLILNTAFKIITSLCDRRTYIENRNKQFFTMHITKHVMLFTDMWKWLLSIRLRKTIMHVSGCFPVKRALNCCANKQVGSGWKTVQWCF
jgi:hypothetical protein